MEKQPEEITPAWLECIIMPTGEIISVGKALGSFKEFQRYLRPKVYDNEKVITVEVRGGVVVDVSGLPEGYVYDLLDHDNES